MPPSSEHSRALDGLRWFAFLGVFLYHSHERVFSFGRYGVQVFFVLSGFLIGNILLGLRRDPHAPLAETLRVFYIRRALRLMPAYYALLAAIATLGMLHVLNPHFEALPFDALYLTNFYLVFTSAQIDSQTHFWSLCVEEHFYLVAPLLLLRWRYASLACIAGIVIPGALLARCANLLFWNNPRFDYLSPLQFDVLVIGIGAAVLLRRRSFLQLADASLRTLGLICGVVTLALVAWSYFPSPPERVAESVLLPPVLGIGTAAFIYAIWNGDLPRTAAILGSRPFAYLGKISYGLYLYHNFTFVFARGSSGIAHEVRLLGSLLLTIGVASASWHLLEQPLLRLKKRYPYPRSGRGSPTLAGPVLPARPPSVP